MSVPETFGAPGAVLLVSCYELGRQPFNLASPWAQLEAAGFGVDAIDAAVTPLDDGRRVGLDVARARLIAISVPMLTALRLGVELGRRLREENPDAHLCYFGLYAALNAKHLLETVADSVIGGEFEEALVRLAQALADGEEPSIDGVVTQAPEDGRAASTILRKLPFVLPKRHGLAPLTRYATFFGPGPDERRAVGYVEATRGCKHRCTHCPVTPVYQGRFFVVPKDVVLADAAQQVEAGARHISFGDPDFLNGPGHAMAVVRELHARHPDVSFDVTAKVEHLLAHRDHLAELAELGCAFVITAVESLSDRVLAELDKGHTRADVFEALALCRRAGLTMRPSLVAFTPWTTLDDYVELTDWILTEGLVDHLEPIQLAIRLLIPPGSALLWNEDERPWLGELDEANFGYRWTHPDPRMDTLFDRVSAC
ncbi:MAG TPA: B12-binding domain-containing radical SAM protein, partial [Polyangiaceae bacterium]|nr:B12-binding domain-containing radical SAM protein [Polyangiaceae bacterium]